MAAVPVDDHDVSPRNVPKFPFLEEVRNIRVDESHPQTTWTQIEYHVPHLAEVESRLHPSVFEFLKRALAVSYFPDKPCENRFFYYCDDLSPAVIMFDDYEMYRGGGVNRITLYLSGGFKEEFRDGLVYVIREM
jgi:hypothetical protein